MNSSSTPVRLEKVHDLCLVRTSTYPKNKRRPVYKCSPDIQDRNPGAPTPQSDLIVVILEHGPLSILKHVIKLRSNLRSPSPQPQILTAAKKQAHQLNKTKNNQRLKTTTNNPGATSFHPQLHV